MAIVKEVPTEPNDIEYRSKKDDAWYSTSVILEEHGNRLRVKFKDFRETFNDEVFSIDDFSSHNEIYEFTRRFRLSSYAVEDNECSKVIEGMMVCAVHREGDESLQYFDAVVDSMHYKEHTPEKCLCTYVLFWQHGPEEGNLTATSLQDIYFIQHAAVNPTLAEFTKLLKEKLTRPATSEFTLTPKSSLSKTTKSNKIRSKSKEFGRLGHNSHVGFCEGREKSCTQLVEHDIDLGSDKKTGSHHYIILENLEKDMCPLLMMDFIHEQTSVTAQAYVFPSLSAETYARGAIMVDSRTNLKRICEFINNPNHFIVSFSGRPWVIAEDKLRTGTFSTNLQSLQPKYENYNTKSRLKVVRLGTKEYTKAKQLKDLYMEFHNHINGLVQRLSVEEKKNRGPYSAN